MEGGNVEERMKGDTRSNEGRRYEQKSPRGDTWEDT